MDNQGMVSSLSDAELLANTRGLIGRSNQVLAALLAHLGEVEARGLHRTRACSSLYAYCIYELRLSEDEAVRRVAAARLVRRFPELLEAVAAGELHLTGLLMLGPHVTRDNLGDVLARARHRTKKEIAKLVRLLDPLPSIPARIEALGPALPGAASLNPSWADQVASFCPVRALQPGDRPRDWTEPDELSAPARHEAMSEQTPLQHDAISEQLPPQRDAISEQPPPQHDAISEQPPPRRSTKVEQALRYKVQFTATEEHVDLMERAAALLSNRGESNGIEEIHLRALRALVEALEKRRYGAAGKDSAEPNPERKSKPVAHPSRHIPARIRRAVFDRDGARCTHVETAVGRCRETHHLEIHHVVPFGLGGHHTAANLTLRCAAHNAYAAELDFSPQHIATQRDSQAHDSAKRAGREADPRAG